MVEDAKRDLRSPAVTLVHFSVMEERDSLLPKKMSDQLISLGGCGVASADCCRAGSVKPYMRGSRPMLFSRRISACSSSLLDGGETVLLLDHHRVLDCDGRRA